MTYDEAQKILADKYAHPLLVQLRAHAKLWANGTSPEHAYYSWAAAHRIEELEASLADLQGRAARLEERNEAMANQLHYLKETRR